MTHPDAELLAEIKELQKAVGEIPLHLMKDESQNAWRRTAANLSTTIEKMEKFHRWSDPARRASVGEAPSKIAEMSGAQIGSPAAALATLEKIAAEHPDAFSMVAIKIAQRG